MMSVVPENVFSWLVSCCHCTCRLCRSLGCTCSEVGAILTGTGQSVDPPVPEEPVRTPRRRGGRSGENRFEELAVDGAVRGEEPGVLQALHLLRRRLERLSNDGSRIQHARALAGER